MATDSQRVPIDKLAVQPRTEGSETEAAKILKILSKPLAGNNKETVFNSYSLPVLKVQRDKKEAKIRFAKRLENKERRKLTAKKLPFYSKERVYERDLKIMAVDESELTSCQVLEQVQLACQGGEG